MQGKQIRTPNFVGNEQIHEHGYQRLIANGKHYAVALIAVMAKFLRLVYADFTTNKSFDPSHEAKRHHHPAPKHTTSTPPTSTDIVVYIVVYTAVLSGFKTPR